MSMMRTFNINFKRKYCEYEKVNILMDAGNDIHRYDNTEFDIEDGQFRTMFEELFNLFAEFVAENHFEDVTIVEVNEVPYDGEEE